MASIRKRGDNSYQITVSCGYDAKGRKLRKTKTVTFPDGMTERQKEKEVQKQAALFEREVENGTYLDGEQITFAEFADKWMTDYAEKQLAPKTLERYRVLLARITHALGHIKLSKLQPNHIIDFYNNLAESGIRNDYNYTLNPRYYNRFNSDITAISNMSGTNSRTIKRLLQGNATTTTTANKLASAINIDLEKAFVRVDGEKGLSDRTLLHHHRLLATVLNSAVQWQLIDINPATRVKPPKVSAKELKILDDDQVLGMLKLLENEPLKYQVAIYIAIMGGLRLGELVGLKWEDLNFTTGILTINKARQYVKDLGAFEKSTKNLTSRRELQLPEIALVKLSALKREQAEERLKLGNLWVASGNILIQNNGDAMFPTTPSQWFKKWLKKTDLPYVTFHKLRHSNASILIAQGTDIATVSKRLGHSRISTTTDIYLHAINKRDAEAANKLDDTFGNKNVSV